MDLQQQKELTPIRELNPANLNDLLAKSYQEKLPQGRRVASGLERHWYIYLIEGVVSIETPEGNKSEFSAFESRAKRPIFSDKRRDESARAVEPSVLLKVDRASFFNYREAQSASGIEVSSHATVEGESSVIQAIFSDYREGEVRTPSMPELALRVRALAEDPDSTITELSQLVQTDPGMAGKVIFAANTVTVRGRSEIRSVRDAVVRLGMKRTRNLTIAYSMQDLFHCDRSLFRKLIMSQWEHTLMTAAHCQILAQQSGRVEPDQLFLIGLLHNIGAVALLAYLEEQADLNDKSTVASVVGQLRVFVSVLILQHWQMGDEYIIAAENATAWQKEVPGYEEILDIINLAQHQAWSREGRGKSLPKLENLPAYKRLQPGRIGDSEILQVIEENSDNVKALQQLFVN